MEIRDKIIIVTGASHGIGRATARHLFDLGAKLVLVARSEEKLKTLKQELSPTNVAVVSTDMRNPEDIQKLIKEAVRIFGRIDVLINNAGQGLHVPVERISLDDLKAVMELNFYGPLLAMQAVIPVFRKQGGGMVINVSSGVTRDFFPGIAGYSATKYALNALSFIARKELSAENIVVSLIRPRITATDFYKNLIGERSSDIQARMTSGELPVDRPEKVAEKIAELIVSEDADLVM